MDWVIPTLVNGFIGVIVGAVGWNIRVSVQTLNETVKSIRQDLHYQSKVLTDHISDHDIHNKT